MTRFKWMDASPSRKKKLRHFGRLTGLAMALTFTSVSVQADLIQYSFTGTDGSARIVKAQHGYINPVGTIKLALSAGLDRVIKVVLLDNNGKEIQSVSSKLLTAEDQITVEGQRTYGAELDLEAPPEGKYTVRAEIQGRWGNAIQVDEYPLVVDITPPKITGIIRTEAPQHYSEINGRNAADRMFSRIYTYRMYVEGVSDDVGIAETRFVNSSVSGPSAGKIESVVKAGYKKETGQASIGYGGSNALRNYFTQENQEYKIQFEAEDLAGNVTSITEFATVSVCKPELNPVPVAHFKPGHNGSFLGNSGFVAWKNGDMIYENPPRIIWGVETKNLYPHNKFGIRNFYPTFTSNGWSYQEVKVAFTKTSSGNEGNWNSNAGWACQEFNRFSAQLAPGVKASPHLVNVETKTTESDFTPQATWLKPRGPVGLRSVRVTVDPQSYVQKLIVTDQPTWTCEIPIGKTQCIADISSWVHPGTPAGIYRPSLRVVDRDNPASGSRIGYIQLAWDSNPVKITNVITQEEKRHISVLVTDVDTDFTNTIFTFTPAKAQLNVRSEDNLSSTVTAQKFSFSGKYDGEFSIDYNTLKEGRYSGSVDVFDQHGNISTALVDNFIVDKTPPRITSNMKNGDSVTSLDEIYFTMTDNMDPSPSVFSINLKGGPTNEDVNMGSSMDSMGRIRAEYPVLFPSLVEGEEYSMTIKGIDSQGNIGSEAISFIYNPRQVSLVDGMDGRIWIPAVEYEFLRQNGHHVIQSQPLTLHDGSPVQGSYDVIATLRADSDAPLVINGTTVYPGTSVSVIRQQDFAASEGRINLPVRAAVGEVAGVAKLLVTTSAPNSPILLADVHLWKGDIDLQSKSWEYRQVIDPLDIIAMPMQGVPCRTTVDAEAARKADIVSDPVCLIEWTETPDEAMVSTNKKSGLTVAGLVGQAVRLGEQKVKYDVFVFSGDGTKVQIGEGERSINVVSAQDSILFQHDKKNAFQKIERLDVRFEQSDGPTCRLTLNADEAITSAARTGRDTSARTCLFEWQIIPNGLMQNQYGSIPQAEGTLDTVGEHTLGWRLSIYSRLGTRITLAEQTAGITVTPPPAPAIRLSSNFDMEDGTLMVPVGENYVGDAVISAENAELTIDITSTGGDKLTERFPRNAWSSLQSITRRIANAETELWGMREITIGAAYYELPEVNTAETYKVYTVPSTAVRPFIETTAKSALDTELLPVTVNMLDMYLHRLPYDETTMGKWNVRVMRQIKAGEYEPLTDFVETINGTANFDVDVSGVEGRTIRLLAEAHLVSPIDGYERIEISPRPLFLGVLLGGEIGGDVVARRISGQAPFNAVFRAVLTDSVMFASVGDIVWEISDDEGSTWEQHIPTERQKFSFVQTFNTGTYRVRAKVVNRHSGIEHYTDQVEITAYDKPMVQVEGPKVLFVGSTATLRAKTVTESMQLDENGKRKRVYTEYPQGEVNIDWSIDGGKTYTQTGDVIEISSDQQERISVWARVRTNHAPADDKNAYTITKSSVEFKTVKPPRIRISGHARVEKGTPYTFIAQATHSYPDMDLPIHGYFTLPDGSRVDSETAVYIPTEDDVQSGRISTTYTAWIEGYREDGAVHTQEIVSSVWQYVWPDFAIDFRTDAQVAPANLTLRVRPLRFSGSLEEPTYKWDLPLASATVTNVQSDTSRQLTINEPGEYEIRVTVRDARGNESVVKYPFSIGKADPYTLDLNYTASNVFMREPVDITIRPEIRGGHPRDRVETREFIVNGEIIESSSLYGRATLTAGDHEIGLRLTSRHGKQEEKTMVITVMPNENPVCEITHRKSRSAVVVYAECEDPDGRVRDYEWTLNGEPVAMSSRSMSVSRRTGGDNPVITVTAVDDSGGRSNTVKFETSFVSEEDE